MTSTTIIEHISKKDHLYFREFTTYLALKEQRFLLRTDILFHFERFCCEFKKNGHFQRSSSLARFLERVQELFPQDSYLFLMYRKDIGNYRCIRIRKDGTSDEDISISIYLDMKDNFVTNDGEIGGHAHIDFNPYYDFYPQLKDTKRIGDGIRYLNRYLTSNIFHNPKEWNVKLFEFIKMHNYQDRQLLVNGLIIQDFDTLFAQLSEVISYLKTKNPEASFTSIEKSLKKRGFEPGWGHTVQSISNNMQLFRDLLSEPDHELLEKFIDQIPMPLVSRVAIISPHGWFAQDNVLGKPDTGGQVIYILDQVKALEGYLTQKIKSAGLDDITPSIAIITRLIPEAQDTKCNVEMEKVYNTKNCWIIRVPFYRDDNTILKNWISRFEVWPYLERFAHEASTRVMSHFQGRPDLIIGNYSDGNLVANLMSDHLDVIQCTIAHALEKSKYLFSDLYWKDNENDYHFSLQFIADLLAMNKADFVIASTRQEITGTETSMGQYESYQFFSLPHLYQVTGGVNLFAPKFNVIPPGVDLELYYPYYEHDKRLESQKEYWQARLFTDNSKDIFGALDNPEKIPIFTMARLDRIKNITGLIEAFGRSKSLRSTCNLIFAAGTINFNESHDTEEQNEIKQVYKLFDRYNLHGQVRWLPSINKYETGEVYRIIADHKGIFVQPALFEAFGLTILEAMLSGLPTFATQFGGPLEIIEPGKSGFLINTAKPEFIARELEKHLKEFINNETGWKQLSDGGISRVRSKFTWLLYSKRLILLTKLYGFWRFAVSKKEKVKLNNYCDLLYHFLFRERAKDLKGS